MNKSWIVLVLNCVLLTIQYTLYSQETYSQFQNHSFRHFDRYVYKADYRFHTSVKPFLNQQVDSVVSLDSIFHKPVNSKFWDLVFNRSAIIYNKNQFAFTIDPVVNGELGKGTDYNKSSWINSRGFLINGSIGEHVSFSTSFIENQAVFNDFRNKIINRYRVIPGQGRPKSYKENGRDYAFSEAYLNYKAGKYFNFQFGHGKNFIGDGYRSFLLSDHAFSYPYFKITTDIWKIKYVNLWMQHQDFTEKPVAYGDPFNKKWAAMHYLDWSVTPWLNIGFFEAIIWQHDDTVGYRGFDINYANPVIFFRPVEFSVSSPDNALMGLNGKLTLWKKQVFYGQFMLDEFKIDEIKNIKAGYWGNKYAIQVGYKTFDLFNLKHLDIQTEINYARPFIYSHVSTLKNYGHYNVSLAHPLGSNFIESVSFMRYNYERIFFEGRFSYAKYGSDTAGYNFGNDIFKSYNDRYQEYNNTLAQADPVNLKYISVKLAYLVNPSTNLNLYVSYTHRNETSATANKNQGLITFGIRTSLQNFYYDY